ncbi:MAG: hypothetical protein ABIJ56_13910 [Pseudomonadota bacterium]
MIIDNKLDFVILRTGKIEDIYEACGVTGHCGWAYMYHGWPVVHPHEYYNRYQNLDDDERQLFDGCDADLCLDRDDDTTPDVYDLDPDDPGDSEVPPEMAELPIPDQFEETEWSCPGRRHSEAPCY